MESLHPKYSIIAITLYSGKWELILTGDDLETLFNECRTNSRLQAVCMNKVIVCVPWLFSGHYLASIPVAFLKPELDSLFKDPQIASISNWLRDKKFCGELMKIFSTEFLQDFTDREQEMYKLFLNNIEVETALVKTEMCGIPTAAICLVTRGEHEEDFKLNPLMVIVTEELFSMLKNPVPYDTTGQ